MKTNTAAIILAGGEGKRMKSERSKVLHALAGKPMIQRTVEILNEVNLDQIIIVASKNNFEDLKKLFKKEIKIVVQERPLGTADAARAGLTALEPTITDCAVLYGDDTAFYKPDTVEKVLEKHRSSNSDITFVTIIVSNPFGLGRVVRDKNKIRIVEEKDATEKIRKINEINDGLYVFKKEFLLENLKKLKPSPVTGELYLTDLIETANDSGKKISTVTLSHDQWHGINTPLELAQANLRHTNKIHFMGICGAGASAVAGIAEENGFQINGCDIKEKSPYSENLKAKIFTSHDESHITADLACLVVSPAILLADSKNKELLKAKDLGIPVVTWQQFQGHILQSGKFVIAVAGGYGKSTTTAMICKILADAGLDPTCEVGAKVLEWNQNFKIGKSKYYVCEADEYNDNYLNYKPDIAVILNISWDHPDYFKNQKDLVNSYSQFISNVKKDGTIILGSDSLIKQLQKTKNAADPEYFPKTSIVKDYGKIELSIIGDFRKENANAALTVADSLGLDLDKAKQSIKAFSGLGRRLEYKGEVSGSKFYDDYAVQPYTIEKTSKALKDKFQNQKVLLVLEPHTISRVNKFFNKFAEALTNTNVDQIAITDVFLAREKGDVKILSRRLVSEIGRKAVYAGSLSETVTYIKKNLKNFDVVCTMGAGNIYKIYDLVKKHG